MIYLATPFWHDNAEIRAVRVEAAVCLTRAYIRSGVALFSPIVHSHALNNAKITPSPLPLTNEQWVDLDLGYINFCQSILVAQIFGWDESKGVAREIEYCKAKGIPINYISYPEAMATIKMEQAISRAA